jgi:hypothetical protein
MPADFLTKNLAFLQQSTITAYAGDDYVWWPAERGSDQFTVRIEVAAATARAATSPVAGLVDIASDQRELHMTAAHFPFQPKEHDCFLLGPALGDGPDPDKCRLYSAKEPRAFGGLIKISAVRQD